MEKFEIVINLEHIAAQRKAWNEAAREFGERVDRAMKRLIHEAVAKRMSATEVAKLAGYNRTTLKSMMLRMNLNPTKGTTLLSRQAAAVLESNAEILGIKPHEIDLMSPLAYLPAGSLIKEQVASVTEIAEFPETPLVHTIDYRDDCVACEISSHDDPILICDDIDKITCNSCRVVLGLPAQADEAGA